MKFCVNFVLKYAYVNYDNSKEKDLIWSCQLFLSLVTLKIGAIIYLQIYLFFFFLKDVIWHDFIGLFSDLSRDFS